ncbi:AraC family transcriptional regulator [Sulfitobacter sp. HNIBRBA3233]|uniref:AraC family transcriptional regulator n=1 Tax=Sulfitobacter marinivivus TaxID=3158558 RepID=UPI0032DE5D4D
MQPPRNPQMHTTAQTVGPKRAARWTEIIGQTYFPLHLDFRDPERFTGTLRHWSLGGVALSRLTSDAVRYTRRKSHLRVAEGEDYLVTIPRHTPVSFQQMGREVTCDPGGFIIERGDAPYRFSYARPNDLFVLKVTKEDLSARVANPDRLCARVFDATRGSAQLFTSMAALAQESGADVGVAAQNALGRQLLTFLALALNEATPTGEEAMSAVRAAHLARIDRFLRDNIEDADLDPDSIAAQCGISKRYLHELYRASGRTVLQRLRDYRLAAVHDDLTSLRQEPLSRIAYRYGFADQAQMSRLFRAKYGTTPTAVRQGSR